MKIAVIWSSPNVDGLTATAKNQIIKGIQGVNRKDIEFEEIHLNKLKINHCMACGNGWGTCRSDGICAINDDFDSVYKKLVEADGIVFVTAVYYGDLTECMKAFIDRLRRCDATCNHFLAEKRCVLIACAGGTGRGTLECLQRLEQAITHMGMRAYDRLPVIRYNKNYMLPTLEQAAVTYIDCLENGFDMYF